MKQEKLKRVLLLLLLLLLMMMFIVLCQNKLSWLYVPCNEVSLSLSLSLSLSEGTAATPKLQAGQGGS